MHINQYYAVYKEIYFMRSLALVRERQCVNTIGTVLVPRTGHCQCNFLRIIFIEK